MTERCEFCGASIRQTEVVVGAPPGRAVLMLIDAEPHPDGRIIERRDGSFRLLGTKNRVAPNRAAFRKHGRSGCDGVPEGQRIPERTL